jgi:hypothetical protein
MGALMRCLVCNSCHIETACTFHPGNRFHAYTTGARDDYRDVYSWTCCAKHELSTVESGRDVPPSISPGCTHARSHLEAARILLVCSPAQLALATACAESLAEEGFEVSQLSLRSTAPKDLEGFACVAVLPDPSDAVAALQLVDAVRGLKRPPWTIVCNVDPKSVETRTQTAGVASEQQLREAIVGGVRSWHGQLKESPYNVFLSYRRIDAVIATTIHRFMPSWWDCAALRPGVDWASEIEVGVRSCKLFALLLKGEIPTDSYIWRELDLAVQHERPVAVLAFRDEGVQVLDRCGIRREDLQEYHLIEPARPGIDRPRPFRLLRAGAEKRPFMYFADLQTQLAWPEASDTRYDYDTPKTVELLNLLRDYPDYRLYSTDPWVSIWSLMTPRNRA